MSDADDFLAGVGADQPRRTGLPVMSPDYVFGKKIPRPQTDAAGNITAYPPQTDARGNVIGANRYTPVRPSAEDRPPREPPPLSGPPAASSITIADMPLPDRRAHAGASRGSVVDFWTQAGAPPHVAEGIADRVGVESSFRPGAWNPNDNGSPSGGQYQHHADRLDRLKAFAGKQGKSWSDPSVQNDFALSEVKGGDSIAAAHWQDIVNAPNRQTAAFLWDRYFERSKGGADPWAGRVTAANGYSVSGQSIAAADRSGRSVFWADPADMLGLLPPIEDTAKERRKGDRLRKSLLVDGEEVVALPEVSGEFKDGKFTIRDYDGRHRLEEAVKAGVTQVPVAFDLPKGAKPARIVGMTGVQVPFDFQAISTEEIADRAKAHREAGAQRAQADTGDAMSRVLAGVAQGAREAFGDRPIGLSEKTAQEGRDLGLFNKPDGPQYPLGMLNEGAARAVAAPIDAVGRGVSAVLGGLGGGVGAVAEEFGMDQGMAARLGRDVTGLGNTALTLSAAAPATALVRQGAAPAASPAPANAFSSLAGRLDARAAAAGEGSAAAAGMTAERAGLAREGMERFDLPLTARGKGATPKIENQRAFNREVSRTIGEDAEALTPPVMDRARRRIGGVFEDIETNNAVRIDDPFIDRLAEIEGAARDSLVDQEYAVVKRQISNIIGRTRGDFLPGRSYGGLLRRNAPLDRAMASANPNISSVAGELREALQDALQRSLSGDDLAAYREARRQYRDLKTIEPIASVSPVGDIDPARLNARLSQRDKRRAYDTSGGALDRLGKIGSEFLDTPTARPEAPALSRGVKAAETALAAGGALTGHHSISGALALGNQLLRRGTQRAPSLTERLITDALGERRSRTAELLRRAGTLYPNGAPGGGMPPNAMLAFTSALALGGQPQPMPPGPPMPAGRPF